MKWIGEIKNNLKLVRIAPRDIQNRLIFISKIQNLKNCPKEKPKKTGIAWSSEKKEAHYKIMEEVWAQIKHISYSQIIITIFF